MDGDPFMEPFYPDFFADERQSFLLPPMPTFIPGLQTPSSPPPQPQASRHASNSNSNNYAFDDSEFPYEIEPDVAQVPYLSNPPAPQAYQSSTPNPSTPYAAWPNRSQHQSLPSFAVLTGDLTLDDWDPRSGIHGGGGAAPETPLQEPNSDDYLAALVHGDFSSPSSYPPFTDTSGPGQANQAAPHQGPEYQQPPVNQDGYFNLQLSHFLNSPPTTSSTPQISSASAHTQTETQTSRSTFKTEIPESIFDSSEDDSDLEIIMAPTTRKRAAPAAAVQTTTPAAKRRRTSIATPKSRTTTPSTRRSTRLEKVEDPFDDDEDKDEEAKIIDIIDLATQDEIPEELKVPKEDKRTKISTFQCVICMDDVAGLTVTHCGHLFCAHCLHAALNIDATKNKCPICRQKIDMKDRETYNSKTKGFWPLELKLMTATRKGKRVSR